MSNTRKADDLARAIEEYFDDKVNDLKQIDASDVNGLEESVQDCVDEYIKDVEISTKNVEGLDDHIQETMEELINENGIDPQNITDLDDYIKRTVEGMDLSELSVEAEQITGLRSCLFDVLRNDPDIKRLLLRLVKEDKVPFTQRVKEFFRQTVSRPLGKWFVKLRAK